MDWKLPVVWTVLVDIAAWLVIHLGVAYLFTQLPAAWFRHTAWPFRQRRWERDGELYARLFAVHRWKRRLPDGAALFKRGFRKKRLASRDPAYLRRFRTETCRAELAHWAVMACAPLFFLFNPVEVGWFMIGYAVLANLPCILVQRYNRCRFNAALNELAPSAGAPSAGAPSAGAPSE